MSDFTDAVEYKRRKGIHYKTALESFKVELKDFEGNKKDKIIELAKLLEESGHPKESISEKVGDDLTGYLSKQYVRKVLGDEFKQKKFQSTGNEGATSSAFNTAEENKKPLLVGADGNIISTIEEDNGERDAVDQKAESALDEIYGGKSFSQMKKEADREIDEEMEDTLENPHNGPQIHDSPPVTPMPLLSNISPEHRELQARYDEAQDMIRQMAEDRDTALSQAKQAVKQFNQLKGGSMAEELQRLKVENNNLKTILSDVDRTSLEKEGYKEIEVLKLNQDTTRMIQEVSGKSQRTFFLLVHPKTMQIKAAKTDVQMHIVQARRNAGLE